jgi:HPr kinase/phosphorylase
MSEVVMRDLVEKFLWDVATGDAQALNRPLTLPDLNRPGLELTGYFPDSQRKRLVILGAKEMGYIHEEMDEIAQRRAFEFLTGPTTPGIVITNGKECPEILMEIAMRKNFPVCLTTEKTTYVVNNVTTWLDEKLAQSVILHGELVKVFGVGVLLRGKSGMGKSEIVLELIQKGHQLVADDRVDCYRIHNTLIGKATPMIEGFMELRGVGIIDVARMYGVTSVASQTEVNLQITLERFEANTDYDRIGIEEKKYTDILGIPLLAIKIPVSEGRPMATIIETAVTNYLLLKAGIDSAKEFEERVLREIAKNKRKSSE